MSRLEQMFRHAMRQKSAPLSLLMLDLDYFKQVNDEFGHQYGDAYLNKMAQVMRSIIREDVDFAFRFGGDEFAMVLFADHKQAQEKAEQVLKLMERKVSIGITTINADTPDGFALEEFFRHADHALYEAKHRGRGRVVVELHPRQDGHCEKETAALSMIAAFDSTKDCKLLFDSAARNESALILLRAKLSVIAQRLGISELKTGNMLLVASELVSNNIKYAGGRGMIQMWQQPGPVLDLVSLDFGPGIPDLELAEQDGYSTANTLGKGIGSVRRLSDELHIYTQLLNPGQQKKWSGSVFLARFFPEGGKSREPDAGVQDRPVFARHVRFALQRRPYLFAPKRQETALAAPGWLWGMGNSRRRRPTASPPS